jgi:predicted O-methyltransferase YrrM
MGSIFGETMITEYLKSRDGTLVEMQEPTDSEYKCFNTGGVETAVGEFLYGLVRMMRPNNIFETGTHMCVASAYMGQALKDNKKGMLTTIEIEKEHIRTSEERVRRLGLEGYVCIDKADSVDYELVEDCELMFLDSEPYLRFNELRRYFPQLLPGGFVFVHDAPRNLCQGNINPDHPEFKSWPFTDINREVKNWVLDNELMPFHFGTPRGLVGLYKQHPSDFKWGRL